MVNTEEHIDNFYNNLFSQLVENINRQIAGDAEADARNWNATECFTQISFPSSGINFQLIQPIDATGLVRRGFNINVHVWKSIESGVHCSFQDFQDWVGAKNYYLYLETDDMCTYSRAFYEDDYMEDDGPNIIQVTAKEVLKLLTEYYKVDYSQEYNFSSDKD